jgi:exonuclease VII large subunit
MLRGFFTADTGAPTGAGAAGATSSAGTQNTDTQAQQQPSTQEHMIPKSRFDEVNTELAELRKWRQERDQADEAAKKKQQTDADEQARQKGEFEKLATERQQRLDSLEQQHKSTRERVQALTEAMEVQIKARMRALPDELKAMVPESADVLTRYDLVGKAEIAAQKLAPAQRTHGTSPGPRGPGVAPQDNGRPTDDLLAEKAARIGGF